MLNSGLRRRLTLATAFFYCALTGASLARADEGDDLATAVIMHIRQHSAAAANLAPADENRLLSQNRPSLCARLRPERTFKQTKPFLERCQ